MLVRRAVRKEVQVIVEESKMGHELAAVERWPETFGELHGRGAHRFRRPEARRRVRRYLTALLSRIAKE